MILLSDANVLIDLGHVNGLGVLPQLAPAEVLDIVLLECEHESQPGLVQDILACGITEVTTDAAWARSAQTLKTDTLSLADALNLYYAGQNQRVLLAGDKPLRDACGLHGVEVHGSIWLVEQAYERGLVPNAALCDWLARWPGLGRRLPSNELRRLQRLLNC